MPDATPRSLFVQTVKRLQLPFAACDRWTYISGLRSTRGLTLPDFLGIGAMKSGTTWLYHNLKLHPDIHMPSPKELHYFDRNFHRSLRRYASNFRRAAGKVRGEITPGYAVLAPSRIAYVRRVMPDVRLVFMMRNPVERAWSHMLHDYVKRAKRPYDRIAEDEILAHFRSPASRERGNYLANIENWIHHFPEEQLFLGFFEDVSRRPVALLRDVQAHIGVEPRVDEEARQLTAVSNRGPGIPLPPKYREFLEELYAPEIDALSRRFGERVADWRPREPALR